MIHHVVRAVAADPRIGADVVAHRPAEEVVDRHAGALTLDIPQRLLDAGCGRGEDWSMPEERAAAQALGDILDTRRINTCDIGGHFPDGRNDRAGTLRDDRFAPSHETVFGRHPNEDPAGRHAESVDGGDAAHEVLPVSNRSMVRSCGLPLIERAYAKRQIARRSNGACGVRHFRVAPLSGSKR
jgi:hypothetical protein